MRNNRLNHLSIQNFIALVYAIVIVMLISIVGVVSYGITSRTIDDNTNEYVFQLVKQINYDVAYYLDNVENILNSLAVDEDIKSFFEGETPINSEWYQSIRADLSGYMVSREDIINIVLVRDDGTIVVNNGDYKVKPDLDVSRAGWYQKAVANDAPVISNSHIQNIIIDRYKWVVSWSVAIRDTQSNELQGVVLVDFNFNLIDDMLNNLSLGDKGYMFIIDEQGNIVYHPKHELIYSGMKEEAIDLILSSKDGHITTVEDGRDKNYIVAALEDTGWKVIGTVYEDELNAYDVITKQIYTLISGLAIILAVLLSIFISRHYLQPIKDLSQGMHKFKHGDLDTRVDVHMENEFGELADDFNDMTVEIKRLVEENQQKEQAKRKYELKSLQSQINPHFLYNTLDSIVWMAEAGMNKAVVEMTFSLSKLFRISINRGSEFVTIEQEIEHIESYLSIQKHRYGEKLDYAIEVDERLLNYRVIKIIIQPIVENAIYHGIKKIMGPGMILIKVEEANGNIVISISDNGVGMENEAIERLLDRDGHSSVSKNGIGVKNVDQRIKLYYGKAYGITIESTVFEGTTVVLTLPKELTNEEVLDEES